MLYMCRTKEYYTETHVKYTDKSGDNSDFVRH